ncbi:hypothetical protein DFH09DRAFT_1270637 [Mycena vulgaris]|nr:hypothetical protein DFH09DRAFT_1270637 [Mycena vulgaris]
MAYILPNELMSEIFIHFLPVYPLCPPQTGPLSPNILTQICRKWREIALTTPALWRAISLYYVEENSRDGQVQTLESWLTRSGVFPLSIQMEDAYSDLPSFEILDAIVPHRARWEYAKLHVLLSDLAFVEGQMPLVRELEISVDGPDFPHLLTVPFPDVPRLRSATLNELAGITVFLPWAQLTSLTLLDTTSSESAEILEQTPNLVSCELVLCGAHLSQRDIHLSSLQTLVLVQLDPDPYEVPVARYLDVLTAPSLRRLQVPEKFLGADPMAALESFISRSECKLQEVRITGDRLVAQAVYRRAFPSVPNLCFNRAWSAWSREEPDDDESDAGSSSEVE